MKLFCDQWLRGSIRKESTDVRAIFADLLAMAGDSAYGDPNIASNGIIQLADDVGFNDEAIARILNVPLKIWLSVKKRLSAHPEPDENRIEIIALSQGFGIRILNWTRYQSEYQRQKKYREPIKKLQPPLSSVSSCFEERNKEGEGEGEEKVTLVTEKVTNEVTNKTPPLEKLPYEAQHKIYALREGKKSLQEEMIRLGKYRAEGEISEADFPLRLKKIEEQIEKTDEEIDETFRFCQ